VLMRPSTALSHDSLEFGYSLSGESDCIDQVRDFSSHGPFVNGGGAEQRGRDGSPSVHPLPLPLPSFPATDGFRYITQTHYPAVQHVP